MARPMPREPPVTSAVGASGAGTVECVGCAVLMLFLPLLWNVRKCCFIAQTKFNFNARVRRLPGKLRPAG